MPAHQTPFQATGHPGPLQAVVSALVPGQGFGEQVHDGLVATLAARSVQRGVRPGGAAAIRRALPLAPALAGQVPSSPKQERSP